MEVARLGVGGVPLARAPFAAQVLRYEALPKFGAATAADLLRRVVGITTADQFGSPIQPDLRFRGFQVGPVVGFPQSISVFVDGVRVNEPDASQVNFNLIPLQAIERVEIVRAPGGVFGRNALAGAINLVTRTGDSSEEAVGAMEASGGSFETGQAQGWVGGGFPGGLNYLFSGRYYRSDGWRDLSRTELRQLFTKLGYRTGGTDLWLSYTFGDDHVEGAGSLPASWLQGELPPELTPVRDPRRLQYTGGQGDLFDPRLHFAVLNVQRELSERTILQLNSFARSNQFSQFNDNLTEPNVRGETDIRSFGGTAQLSFARPSGVRMTGGVEYVRNRVRILIFAEPNPTFPTAGGMTEDVESTDNNLAAFGNVWWPISPRASLTGSLRYDYIDLPITDNLDPENSGENAFSQLTGSLGADLMLAESAILFASYGRGFRAPVILEITCADPDDPCPLPFELGADPPLDPVTTDTWQTGFRYFAPHGSSLELVGYWAEVYNDLFAVIAPPSTRGYFRNLERTRRQGLELSALLSPSTRLELRGSAALTRATFQTEAELASALVDDDDEAESTPEEEEEGGVEVRPGDRFAMIPNVSFEIGMMYRLGNWGFALEGNYVGSQFFIGDEDNSEEFGNLQPYFLLNGDVQRSFDRFQIFLQGRNLLNTSFESFGLISPNVRGPESDPQPFLTPGLPFRLTAGVRYQF